MTIHEIVGAALIGGIVGLAMGLTVDWIEARFASKQDQKRTGRSDDAQNQLFIG